MSKLTLRPARPGERKAIFEWLACSDVTPLMMGPPHFPEVPVPDWGAFCRDYGSHFFDGSNSEKECSFIIEADGVPVGHIAYEVLDQEPETAELDIWLRSRADCGKRVGVEGLRLLMDRLHGDLGIHTFVIRPSRRNEGACRAHRRAGFTEMSMTDEEQAARFGPGDYPDSVVLVRNLSEA